MNELILIEDFAPLRRILTQSLRDAGFNVTSFEDGVISGDPEVLKHADLLITDIVMPTVDGHEVLENIRASMPGLRTVVISGIPAEDLESVEATAILCKPFEPDQLVSTINGILSETATA